MTRAAVASSCYRQAEEWQVRAAQKGRRVVGGATDAGCKRQTQVGSCFVTRSTPLVETRPPTHSKHISSFEYRNVYPIKLTSTRHNILILSFLSSFQNKINHTSPWHASSGTIPLLVTHIQDRPNTQRKPIPRISESPTLSCALLDRVAHTPHARSVGTSCPYRLSEPPIH